MNWIIKLKKLGENIKKNVLKKFPSREQMESSKWKALNCCNSGPISKDDLKNNFFQCKNCLTTFQISPEQRFEYMFLNKEYEKLETPTTDSSGFDWEDASGKYTDKLNKTRKKTGRNSALTVAFGNLTEDLKAVVVASDWKYFGSSISPDEGESIVVASEKSIKENSPLIIFAQGGGMRVQIPGATSLMMMPKSIIALSEVKNKNIPIIVIVDTVVSGGISASYLHMGDFLFFEGKKSRAMFAGPRVAANASQTTPPENFLEATWALQHGHCDAIIEKRKDTKNYLISFLNIILKNKEKKLLKAQGQNQGLPTGAIDKEAS